MKSKMFFGQVRHRRFAPVDHQFKYGLFMLYIDLDELPTLFQRFWFWSVNKKNLASFNSTDYLGGNQNDVKQGVIEQVEKKYQEKPNGPIRMLTHLRYFGHCFNPVTFYYCFDKTDSKVEYVVAQINNTPWDERFCYVLKNSAETEDIVQRIAIDTTFDKAFHVSPFLPMDMQYQWRFTHPEEWLTINMKNFQSNKKIFDVTLALQAHSITSKNLAWALVRFPLMTVQVVVAIYWQAVKLFLKKVPFYSNKKALNATSNNSNNS